MGVGRLEETLIDKLHQCRQSLARGCRKAWEGYHRNDENARLKLEDLLNGQIVVVGVGVVSKPLYRIGWLGHSAFSSAYPRPWPRDTYLVWHVDMPTALLCSSSLDTRAYLG